MRRLRLTFRFLRVFGGLPTLRFVLPKLLGRWIARLDAAATTVHPRRASFPLRARLGGSSDLAVLCQIFVVEEFLPLRPLANCRTILDLGANAGYSAAYLLSAFPEARLLAVEPDPRNHALCVENLRPFGERARVLLGAVWPETMRLNLSVGTYGDGLEWATQVVTPEDGQQGSTLAWDMEALMDLAGAESIDLLKIDIEGSEQELFSRGADKWLGRVRNMSIELHGAECEESFFAALAGMDYEIERSGELVVCRNLRPKQAMS